METRQAGTGEGPGESLKLPIRLSQARAPVGDPPVPGRACPAQALGSSLAPGLKAELAFQEGMNHGGLSHALPPGHCRLSRRTSDTTQSRQAEARVTQMAEFLSCEPEGVRSAPGAQRGEGSGQGRAGLGHLRGPPVRGRRQKSREVRLKYYWFPAAEKGPRAVFPRPPAAPRTVRPPSTNEHVSHPEESQKRVMGTKRSQNYSFIHSFHITEALRMPDTGPGAGTAETSDTQGTCAHGRQRGLTGGSSAEQRRMERQVRPGARASPCWSGSRRRAGPRSAGKL